MGCKTREYGCKAANQPKTKEDWALIDKALADCDAEGQAAHPEDPFGWCDCCFFAGYGGLGAE